MDMSGMRITSEDWIQPQGTRTKANLLVEHWFDTVALHYTYIRYVTQTIYLLPF